MKVEIMLMGLLVVSTLTSLVTEAVKSILLEHGIKYHANTLAGIVAIAVAVAVFAAYVILVGLEVTPQLIVCAVALVAFSWLCAMVGYDKVMQTIAQIRSSEGGGSNGF